MNAMKKAYPIRLRQQGFSLVGLTWLIACVSLGSWMLVRANAMQPPTRAQHTKAIEDVKVGDWVLAKDQNDSTSPLTARKVEATFVRTATVLRVLRIESVNGGSQELKTTDEHPFWVDGSGWVKAGDLKVGQKLVDSNGQFATLMRSTTEPIPTGKTVYNFRVADAHTYFVAAENTAGPSIWVHNARNYLKPDPQARGPHSTFRRDPQTGDVTHYQTWHPQSNPQNPNPWEAGNRFDASGGSHFNNDSGLDVPTPHVHDPKFPGGVRQPTPSEIPK